MAVTPSTMLELGTSLPSFNLISTENQRLGQDDVIEANGLLVCFICNHCPFVIHIAKQLAKIGRDFEKIAIGVVAINSNDTKNYPQDSFDRMIEEKEARGYSFPYLFDETQSVARSFAAACTPDFFLFDANKKLYYRGRLDESRPGNSIISDGKDLRVAAEAMIAGKTAPEKQLPSMGCNIKWFDN